MKQRGIANPPIGIYTNPKTYLGHASEILEKEFGKGLEIYEIESSGTITKNHSFIIKKDSNPEYFLKLHCGGKPLREKKATEFYGSNNIVKTPKIVSIGEDYTLTNFEYGLKEPNFVEHVSNLADFHHKLTNTDHQEILRNRLFKTISRKDLFDFIGFERKLLKEAVPFDEFRSLFLSLPFSEDLGMEHILIHGDPHRQNILMKDKEKFFLDLEHTRYSLPTVDLAKLSYNYHPSEIERILAIYTGLFIPGGTSKKNFIAGTLSDILLEGASSVVTCQIKDLDSNLTENWIKNFRNYFTYLSNST